MAHYSHDDFFANDDDGRGKRKGKRKKPLQAPHIPSPPHANVIRSEWGGFAAPLASVGKPTNLPFLRTRVPELVDKF